MKTFRFLVELDSCPEMGLPDDEDPKKVLDLIEQALQDGGLDNDLSARVRPLVGREQWCELCSEVVKGTHQHC